jgi:2-dehydropantoate 2-reductase
MRAIFEGVTMRVIVYGAGAVGGVIGGYLALAGQETILVARPAQAESINQQGLRLVTTAGTHVLWLPTVTRPDQVKFGHDDVVFLCMKGQNTEEALRDLTAVTSNLPVFCFQNGVRNEEIAAHYFERVYGVMVGMLSIYLTNGEVSALRDPPGLFVMGCYPQGSDELVEEVAAGLRTAGFQVMVTLDIMPYKWGKLLANLTNVIEAITDARGSEIDAIVHAVREELRGVLTRAGVRWIEPDDLAREWPGIKVPPRGRPGVDMRSSTWQSLARGVGSTEAEFLNGEVVRQAEKLECRAPVNEALVRIAQDMADNREMPGKYTPGQLCELLGLR